MQKQKKRQLNKAGFTILELLVVIAVIGFMASVILSAVNGVRKNARNSRRNGDVRQLINAFNLAHDGGNAFPQTYPQWACVSSSCYGNMSGNSANPAVDAFLAPYLAEKPADPVDGTRGGGAYIYMNVRPAGWVGSVYFTSGAHLAWLLEPSSANSCGPGLMYVVGSSYVGCMIKID